MKMESEGNIESDGSGESEIETEINTEMEIEIERGTDIEIETEREREREREREGFSKIQSNTDNDKDSESKSKSNEADSVAGVSARAAAIQAFWCITNNADGDDGDDDDDDDDDDGEGGDSETISGDEDYDDDDDDDSSDFEDSCDYSCRKTKTKGKGKGKGKGEGKGKVKGNSKGDDKYENALNVLLDQVVSGIDPKPPTTSFPHELLKSLGGKDESPLLSRESSREAFKGVCTELNRNHGLLQDSTILFDYHQAKYPNDGTYGTIIRLLLLQAQSLQRDGVVRVLIMAAASGLLGEMLTKAWAEQFGENGLKLVLVQADVIPDEEKNILGVDEYNRPIDARGEVLGDFDAVIARNCWYSQQVAFNQLNCGMLDQVRDGGFVVLGMTRGQMVNVAPTILAAENARKLFISAILDENLDPEKDPNAFVVVGSKLANARELSEGPTLINEIFFGEDWSTDPVNATKNLQVPKALEIAQLRETLLPYSVHKVAKFLTGLGIIATGSLLLRHTQELREAAEKLVGAGANLECRFFLGTLAPGISECIQKLIAAREQQLLDATADAQKLAIRF
jgi:hypothetical protein